MFSRKPFGSSLLALGLAFAAAADGPQAPPKFDPLRDSLARDEAQAIYAPERICSTGSSRRTAPNRRWVGEYTEFVIGESGKLYLAVILDLFSRFVVGWAVSAVNDRHLTLKALGMALKRREDGRPAAPLRPGRHVCERR